MKKVPILTIDGPSGSGKGTIGQAIARQLGWHFLDSGAIYRVLAHAAAERHVNLEDEDALAALAAELDIKFVPQEHGLPKVCLAGEDITAMVRSKECGMLASPISAFPKVRKALLKQQHDFHRAPGLVADGRDMGTVVFPEAHVKVYLDASVEERARRRYKQLKEREISVNLPEILAALKERDARDTERAVSPLKPAEDAVVIDATDMSIAEVLQRILKLLGDLAK